MFKKFCKLVKYFLIIIVIFVLGGLAGVFGERFVMPWLSGFESLQKYDLFKKANEQVTIIRKTEQVRVQEDYSVSNIAQGVLPSVVSVITFKEDGSNEKSNIFKNRIRSSEDIQKNIKTGLILTGDGLIVSVMDDLIKEQEELSKREVEKSIQESDYQHRVLAKNGKEYQAELKAVDPYSNLVFYKIDADNLPIPALGDSEKLEMGEKAVVCGNAGGEYQNTFSSGVIQERDKTFTLLNSELSSSEKMEGALLVNAKIDQKNIGGPVMDFNGDVVGIANAVEKDGQYRGFVMPINQIKPIIDGIIQTGDLQRPTLGLYYLSINREIALLNSLPVNSGALVYSFSGQQGLAVMTGSPADKAGILIGDIITKAGGKEVNLQNPLAEIISSHEPGDKISLEIIRNGEKIETEAELE
ncbi:MAG: S1C family serine protease [Candidatus Moranbacteria bacterium]|nr:S1C family serine protease [Candidatus Moranbacteria bacterium]